MNDPQPTAPKLSSSTSIESADRFPIVVAVTGASGAIFASRMLQVLLASNQTDIHLTISPSGAAVVQQELGVALQLARPNLADWLSTVPDWMRRDRSGHSNAETRTLDATLIDTAVANIETRLYYHHYQDYMTPIASGSFRTSGMVVCPCSGSTLSAISLAAASNLISRAAEVHLKEHRRLVLVPRETPLSVLQIENMQRVAAAGAVVLPAAPGWYHNVQCMTDLVDFIVSRILDQLGCDNHLIERWKATE